MQGHPTLCIICREPTYGKKYCWTCFKKLTEQTIVPEDKNFTCIRCDKVQPLDQFKKAKEPKKFCRVCKTCREEQYRHLRRMEFKTYPLTINSLNCPLDGFVWEEDCNG